MNATVSIKKIKRWMCNKQAVSIAKTRHRRRARRAAKVALRGCLDGSHFNHQDHKLTGWDL
jgi:hypothetical protein